MKSTKDVINNHLRCFDEGNLEGILDDYSANAVLFTTEGPLKGRTEIKPLFEALLAEFGKPGASFKPLRESFVGDYAYLVWSAETADNVYELATDTFVVRDGKKEVQSFAAKTSPKH